MKAVVAAFNQEKALVGAFSVITTLRICFGWNFLKHYARLGVDTICQERETLGRAVMVRVNTASEPWGIVCARYEVRDIALPAAVHRALQMQVESERKKRAAVLGEDTQHTSQAS